MNNKNMTAKERGLLKGAARRVFSRSDLRRAAIAAAQIEHHDPDRPRVKKWVICAECKQPTAAYQAQADHKVPIVPINSSLEEMNWDTLVNNLWCDINLLQILCPTCHSIKTKVENAQRRALKKERQKNVK